MGAEQFLYCIKQNIYLHLHLFVTVLMIPQRIRVRNQTVILCHVAKPHDSETVPEGWFKAIKERLSLRESKKEKLHGWVCIRYMCCLMYNLIQTLYRDDWACVSAWKIHYEYGCLPCKQVQWLSVHSSRPRTPDKRLSDYQGTEVSTYRSPISSSRKDFTCTSETEISYEEHEYSAPEK
jgi:hypothetical protein